MRILYCIIVGWLASFVLAMSAHCAELPNLQASDFQNRVFRGFTLEDGASKSAKDFDDLASMGVNLVRVGITLERCAGCREYSIPPRYLVDVDQVLMLAAARKIHVILTLVPERPDGAAYWEDATLQQSIIDVWGRLAERFKGNTSMGGFDLINEPNPPGNPSEASRRFFDFAVRIGRRIRTSDPHRMIVFEPAPRGNAYYGFKALERPLPFDNVLYSPHLYWPVEVTHQGVAGSPTGQSYPGPEWNKAKLSGFIQPARDFSRKHQVPIYVGEFSCIRFAPDDSGYLWIRDAADLIEAERWSWTFHSFRGWHGWDQELPPRMDKPATPAIASTLRSLRMPVMVLLRSYFDKNRPGTP